MTRNAEADRARVTEIRERYDEHLQIAGKTTDMLDDMGFLLDVVEALQPAPIQQPKPTTVETPVAHTGGATATVEQEPGAAARGVQQAVVRRERGQGGRNLGTARPIPAERR